MRTSTLLTIFVILNIVFSGANAVFLKKPSKATYSVFNQLKNVENSNFGKKILDTIALQVKNKSPLGDIAKLLAEIREKLAIDQSESDQLHSRQEKECEETVAKLDSDIANATATKDDSEQQITLLNMKISGLKGEIANKENQLEILDRRDVALADARVNDKVEFAQRQENAVQVIGALELIIEKLQTIDANTNDDSLVLAELNKIGGSNPIMALVQVAATFSQDSLDNVVAKLEDLRASIDASIEDDKRNEGDAEAEFAALEQEIKKTRVAVQQDKAEAETQLSNAQSNLSMQEKRYATAVQDLLRFNEQRVAKVAECEAWAAQYAEDKESRSGEIAIVKEVEAIIATKLDTMKDYLKDRANNE